MKGITIKRSLHTFVTRLVLLLSVGSALPLLAADEKLAQDGVPYTRIVATADGESHFEDGLLPFSVMNLPGGHLAGLHNTETGGQASYMMFPSGVFEDWHPTPNAQMLIVVQGEVQVGVSSGEVRTFTAGDVVMMEDNHGKGHTTRTVGDVPHIALMVRKPAP